MKPRTVPKRLRKPAVLQQGGARRGLLFAGAAVVIGVGLYALAGHYGGPWLIERWLRQAAAPGSSISGETIRFDPFTLVAEVVALDVRTADNEGESAAAAGRLVVDFAARSLIELRPVVSSIVIERPRISIAAVTDLSAFGRRVRSTALARARIDRLDLSDGSFDVDRGAGRSIEWPRFDLSLTDFDAASGTPGRFSLEASTSTDASVAADGSLAADLERADGQLRLGALSLGAVAAEVGEIIADGPGGLLGAVGLRGRVDLAADFSATTLLTEPALELSGASFELSESTLTPAAGLTVTAGPATGAGRLRLAAKVDGADIGGRFELNGVPLTVGDAASEPPQSFAFDDAALLITIDDDRALSLRLDGRLRGAGEAALNVRVSPETAAPRSVSIVAADLPARVLSAYSADTLDRRLVAGFADLGLDYSLNGDRVDGSLQVGATGLELAARTPEPAANGAAFSPELAAALLEDADGRIEIELPFAAGTGSVRDAVAAALRARLATMTAMPFATLAPLLDGIADAASAVPFRPGDAALDEQALASIARLAGALKARPRLGVRVHGGYDAVADRNALAKQQIELHVQLATAGPSLQARPAPVDFGSARAQDVLDEFAGERLPAGRLAALAADLDCDRAGSPECRRAYYALIFDALVANEEIAGTALNRLGRFRALSVVDALRQQGIADERVELVTGGNVVETPLGIGLPIELTAAATAR